MQDKIIMSLCLSFLMNCLFAQQDDRIDFFIINEAGEAVVNAHLTINNSKSLISNEAGYCATTLTSGSNKIKVSHIAYSTFTEILDFQNDTSIYITLLSRTFETVEISARTSARINQLSDINVEQLRTIPGLVGNKDLIRSLTFLPGVSPTSEGSVNFSVRGGESYQNSILIDRSQVYNISHLFGLLSTVNPDIVNDIKLYKNYIPARFGNAGSSVVDISILRGNNEVLEQKIEAGLTNFGYNINGPIIKNKLHFNFSARSAFLGVLTSPLYILYKAGVAEGYANYNLFDNNFKLSYSPTKKDRITLHYYSSLDNMLTRGRSSEDSENHFNYGWRNNTLNLSYYKSLGKGIFFNNYVNYSHFSTKLKNKSINGSKVKEITGFQRINSYNNLNFQSEINKSLDKSVFRFGIHYDYSWFNPIKLLNIINSEELGNKDHLFSLNSIGIFSDNDYSFNSKLNLNYGIRLSVYQNKSILKVIPEPRISLKYGLNEDAFLELSYSRLSQSRVQYPIVNFGLPLEIWIPISEDVPPPIVSQINFSYVVNDFLVDNLNLTSAIYYKELIQLTTLSSVLPFFVEFDENYNQYLHKDGTGKAYGFELGIEYSNKILNAYAGYHLSKSFRQFSEINDGDKYPFEFNRAHELSSYVGIKLSPSWQFTGSFNFSTGTPVTLPTGYINFTEDFQLFLFNERNNYRNTIYHRGDIAFAHKSITRRDRARTWTFSIYNLYYRQNPYDTTISIEDNGSYNLNKISVFPIIPSILYSLEF